MRRSIFALQEEFRFDKPDGVHPHACTNFPVGIVVLVPCVVTKLLEETGHSKTGGPVISGRFQMHTPIVYLLICLNEHDDTCNEIPV